MVPWQKTESGPDPLCDESISPNVTTKYKFVHGTLHSYGYELPLPVAMYIFKIYKDCIFYGSTIKPSFFSLFTEYKDQVRFVFDPVKFNGRLSPNIFLRSVKIYDVDEDFYFRFRDNHPDFDDFRYEVTYSPCVNSNKVFIEIRVPQKKPGS